MKKNKVIVFAIVLICVVGVMINTYLVWLNLFTFKINTENFIVDANNYSIKVTKIKSNDRKLNKEIDNIIDSVQNSFIKEVNNKEGELTINYEYSKYNDIYSFHIKSISSIKNIIKRKDHILYYDKNERKVLKQKDLIKRDYGLYTIFNSKCVDYLKEKNISEYDENLLEIDDKNYQLLVFSNEEIYVLIINNNKEISVPIKYGYIKEYLKEPYYKGIEKIEEELENKEIEVTEDKKETVQENVDKTEELNFPKYIAFTFDDGPSPSTTIPLLDGLKERNAKATFFVLGNRAENQIDIITRMISEGHLVGSHTYSHKNLLKLNLTDALEDINKTNDILTNISGVKPKYLRPPYGNYNKNILENSNMTFILWSVDTEDWKKRDTELIYDYIINNVNDGDIVLLHDLYQTSVEGVLKAMDYLSTNNYRFVTVEELFNKKGITPEINKSYRYVR